ncbi:MAG: histidine kinase dimerization/phospho-acceptor domain-containing protein [Desulfobacterales bacterium]
MEAVGTLAGGIAHDFNNILTAIIGFTEEIISEDVEEGSDFGYAFKEILNAGHRAKDLVQQILTFAAKPSMS